MFKWFSKKAKVTQPTAPYHAEWHNELTNRQKLLLEGKRSTLLVTMVYELEQRIYELEQIIKKGNKE